MKQLISGALVAAFIFTGVQVPSAQALSCLDPAGMLEYYVSEDSYVIFTATAGETTEYVKEAAPQGSLDPNQQFNSGYTGQYVEVSEAHKGYPASEQWVYFQKDSTWGYLCSGGPGEVGEEWLYIINQPTSMFELPQVVNIYPADSPLAADIIAALAESEVEGESNIEEVRTIDWINRLRTDMLDMLFIARVKLGELRWWYVQS